MECVVGASRAVKAAKFHIEEIRSKKFSIGKKYPNPLTQDLHHAVTSLSAELYTKDVHFLMELIQVSLSLSSVISKWVLNFLVGFVFVFVIASFVSVCRMQRTTSTQLV